MTLVCLTLDGFTLNLNNYTAPTNDAFAALDDGVLDSLLLPENVDTLTKILTYHVLAANVPSTAVTNGDVETVSGDSITIAVSDSGVKINEANVITADVIGSNGIVHVIDKVLIPPLDVPDEKLDSIYGIASTVDDFSTLGAYAFSC